MYVFVYVGNNNSVTNVLNIVLFFLAKKIMERKQCSWPTMVGFGFPPVIRNTVLLLKMRYTHSLVTSKYALVGKSTTFSVV